MCTDLCFKPKDGHQYPRCHASHPFHIKTSIPCSQALKVCRFSSSKKDLKTHVCCLREMFLVRGYFKKVVNDHKYNVAFGKN